MPKTVEPEAVAASPILDDSNLPSADAHQSSGDTIFAQIRNPNALKRDPSRDYCEVEANSRNWASSLDEILCKPSLVNPGQPMWTHHPELRSPGPNALRMHILSRSLEDRDAHLQLAVAASEERRAPTTETYPGAPGAKIEDHSEYLGQPGSTLDTRVPKT